MVAAALEARHEADGSGVSIDGGAAVHFKNGNYYKSLRFYENSNVYHVSKSDEEVIEEKQVMTQL